MPWPKPKPEAEVEVEADGAAHAEGVDEPRLYTIRWHERPAQALRMRESRATFLVFG
jgi:hypothetical protein